MKRAALAGIAVLAALSWAEPAQADCTGNLAALKAKLPEVTDAKRREELWLMLEKASVDEAHGRTHLCESTLERAKKLAR